MGKVNAVVKDTWIDFFGTDYIKFSENILSAERTLNEVEGIGSLLNLPLSSTILDLGCGQGRIAVPLAKLGYKIFGYDASAVLLEEAHKRAIDAKVDINYELVDMRVMDQFESFDAIINIGTAFGYVPEESDDCAIIKNIYRALKPGGIFILDTENRDNKIRNFIETYDSSMNGTVINTERNFDASTGRWEERMKWQAGGEERTATLNVRLYAATELKRMMTEAGFQLIDMYGSLYRERLDLSSTRLVIVAKKGF
ncbi:methyltransferase family protein [Paenibacillus cellulosilyticus]|uniref:Methyltransferase family protein n=1 Tax=Paenibacillus cellulosilyticus TaxID=375489 RepID=A0A2V2YU33_9BACL|nr:methyltransferase family protein [Paenibacillus cellulosilyticus]